MSNLGMLNQEKEEVNSNEEDGQSLNGDAVDMLFEAASSANIPLLAEYLGQGADIEATQDFGASLLYYAARGSSAASNEKPLACV